MNMEQALYYDKVQTIKETVTENTFDMYFIQSWEIKVYDISDLVLYVGFPLVTYFLINYIKR